MIEHDAVTAPIAVTIDNAQEILKSHLYKIQEANRRYESKTKYAVKMRETDWQKRRIKAEWSLFTAELVKQGYRCACCRIDIDERACVHTNRDGDIRGIICHRCNIILSYSHDDCYLLLQAIVYLMEK